MIIAVFTSFFRKKNKNYSNLVLCLFEGIWIFLDETDIVNVYPPKSTWTFLTIPTF